MSEPKTLRVSLSGALGDFVDATVGSAGRYENATDYILDLIRRDKERVEADLLVRLRSELQPAFAGHECAYRSLNADMVITRNSD